MRAAAATKSILDDLPGVGPARKRALLRVFGTAKGVRNASVDEIAAVPGIPRSLAETIGPTWTAEPATVHAQRTSRPRPDPNSAIVPPMRRVLPSFVILVFLVAAAIVVWPSIQTKLGLDLIGGLRGEYQLVATDQQAITPE